MKILMINPVHPHTAHISALRAWRFSQELAALGHQVVLLTGTTEKAPTQPSLAVHDWQQPFVLACTVYNTATAKNNPLPAWIRRARTALRMLRHGGDDALWVTAAVKASCNMAPEFIPDVIWCTFGKLEAVVAAKRIARKAGCPWVLDVKDNWELYVPPGLRALMARRIHGWRAATANAQLTQNMSRKWLGADAALIYSGVEDCFLARPDDGASPNFEINLVGGIYFARDLDGFLAGVATWYATLSGAQRSAVRLRYLGGQGDMVRMAVHARVPHLTLDLPGYIAAANMARLCQQAAANAYIAHPGTFHHKLLELLACGRQVIAYPSENTESVDLAEPQHQQLHVAAAPADVAALLSDLSEAFFAADRKTPNWPPTQSARYAWPKQTILLQRVLTAAASSNE